MKSWKVSKKYLTTNLFNLSSDMDMPSVLPLTNLPANGLPPAVLVCGDPDRASGIARRFDDYRVLSQNREYDSYIGHYHGMPVAVCSHGIGAPGAAIAFEEIIRAGGRRIIRVGTCGSLQPGTKPGHLVIATSAVANTGYIRETVPEGYPAVADVVLTLALRNAAIKIGHEHTSGIVLTRDNFYAGVEPVASPSYEMMSKANVVAVEMECAALFVIGTLRKVQTAAILAVDGNVLESGGEMMESYRPEQESVKIAVDVETIVALDALRSQHDESD